MTRVLDGLCIREDRIRDNLNFLHGINMAESVMIELTRKGMDRQEAHEVVRKTSMEALAGKRALVEVLINHPEVSRLLSPGEIEGLLNPDNYIGTAVLQVERVIEKLSPLTR
jgi:adenylosuccinate lyase